MTMIFSATNLVESGTISVTSEAAGYEKENLQTPFAFDRWTGVGAGSHSIVVDHGAGGTVPTFFALAGHDLFTQGASAYLQKSTDGSTYTALLASFTPANNKTLGALLTGAQRYTRIVLTGCTAAPSIGVLHLGVAVTPASMPEGGFDPDEREVQHLENRSRSGQYLGYGRQFMDYRWSLRLRETSTFVDSYWKPFWLAAMTRPFFFAWDIAGHAADVYYCIMDRPKFRAPYLPNSRMIEQFSFRALSEDTI